MISEDAIIRINNNISQIREMSPPIYWPIIDQTSDFVDDVLTRSEDYKYGDKEFCEICGKKLSKRSHEIHHVAGRLNSDICVDVCIPCHRTITSRQMLWDVRWRSNDNLDNVKMAFLLQGLREILVLRGEKLNQPKIIEIGDSLDFEASFSRDRWIP